MAPTPKPPEQRRRRNVVKTGDWKAAPAGGWRFGDPDARANTKARKEGIPSPPATITDPPVIAIWEAWFSGWWAVHWELEDLPALRDLIALYSSARHDLAQMAKIAPLLDRFGLTPEGRHKLRWLPPKDEAPAKPERPAGGKGKARLRVVESA